jgi:hypothetical protein
VLDDVQAARGSRRSARAKAGSRRNRCDPTASASASMCSIWSKCSLLQLGDGTNSAAPMTSSSCLRMKRSMVFSLKARTATCSSALPVSRIFLSALLLQTAAELQAVDFRHVEVDHDHRYLLEAMLVMDFAVDHVQADVDHVARLASCRCDAGRAKKSAPPPWHLRHFHSARRARRMANWNSRIGQPRIELQAEVGEELQAVVDESDRGREMEGLNRVVVHADCGKLSSNSVNIAGNRFAVDCSRRMRSITSRQKASPMPAPSTVSSAGGGVEALEDVRQHVAAGCRRRCRGPRGGSRREARMRNRDFALASMAMWRSAFLIRLKSTCTISSSTPRKLKNRHPLSQDTTAAFLLGERDSGAVPTSTQVTPSCRLARPALCGAGDPSIDQQHVDDGVGLARFGIDALQHATSGCRDAPLRMGFTGSPWRLRQLVGVDQMSAGSGPGPQRLHGCSAAACAARGRCCPRSPASRVPVRCGCARCRSW